MIQSVSNVMSGFLVSFIENWKITLVMMASAPVLGIVQGVADKVKLSPFNQKIRFFYSTFMTKNHRGRVFVRADQSVALCPVLTFPFVFIKVSRNSQVKNHILRYCQCLKHLFVYLDGQSCLRCSAGNELLFPVSPLSSSSLSLLIGSLSNFDDDHNDDFKKTIGPIGLMIKTTALHVHHAFQYISLTCTVRLRRETPLFDVLWRTWTYGDEFSFLVLNVNKILQNSTLGKVACI